MRSLQTIVRRHRASALGVEQRQHTRYSVPGGTRGEVRSPSEVDALQARVLNLSLGGAGLLLDSPCRPGDLLHIEFSRSTPNFTCTLLLCIVHCTQQRDGQYLMGGRFIDQLEPAELHLLIS